MPKTEISFEIVEHIGVLSTGSKGWTKELNLISWNGVRLSTTFANGLRSTTKWVRV